jgi:endonuclease YncB( thermonuclease family)
MDYPVDIIEELKNSNDTLPIFSLNGLITYGKIVDVYDGDTCTINILIPNTIETSILGIKKTIKKYTIQKYKCRMFGYDCAEMKPLKTDPNRDIIKDKAIKARLFFCELVGFYEKHTNLIVVQCLEFDKYGRLLVNLFDKSNNKINDIMIQKNHGYLYTGGKKDVDKIIY